MDKNLNFWLKVDNEISLPIRFRSCIDTVHSIKRTKSITS